MKYELAKRLKNAGFPQDLDRVICEHTGKTIETGECVAGNCEYCCVPTLEVLLEACGDEFVLYRDREKIFGFEWIAGTGINADGEIQERVFGASPSEAVAKLWLKLNKK